MALNPHAALAGSLLFRKIRKAFFEATGLEVTLIPGGKSVLRRAPGRSQLEFCRLMSQSKAGCAGCLEVQRELQRRLDRKLTPQQIRCFAGLTEFAVPVLIAGEHVATLIGGRFRERALTRSRTRELARQLGKSGVVDDWRQTERAYLRVGVVPAKRVRGALELLTILANQLTEACLRVLGDQSGNDPLPVTRAKDFVYANAAEGVSLRDAAEHAHLSRHYFCKVFKRSTGMTFTDFVGRVRVDMAHRLLRDPSVRISEAAFQAGFQSISQFNRVFRRVTGLSPTKSRKKPDRGNWAGNLAISQSNYCAKKHK